MNSKVSPEQIRTAKESLTEKYRTCDWFTGAGIARGETGLELRLNVDPDIQISDAELPDEWEGIPVQIVRVRYSPRANAG